MLPRGLFSLQPTLIFPFSEKNLASTLHTTEFSPQWHIPLVPCVPKRQQGAVKRAYNLGPVGWEPIIPIMIQAMQFWRSLRSSTGILVHPPKQMHCVPLDDEPSHFSVDGQWATSNFLKQQWNENPYTCILQHLHNHFYRINVWPPDGP